MGYPSRLRSIWGRCVTSVYCAICAIWIGLDMTCHAGIGELGA